MIQTADVPTLPFKVWTREKSGTFMIWETIS
jgi:hypothetical protein